MPASSNIGEFRHFRSGSLNIPSASEARPNGMMSPIAGARFDGPRSPPNTSHVPCKFFRQSACQAGAACPFSHDLSIAAENVCKYFAKGNCKFGPKCANIHVLPDGRRINYGKNGVTIGAAPINLGGRVNPTTYHHPSSSALTNSFMRGADGMSPPHAYGVGGMAGYLPGDERVPGHQLGRQPSMENGLPTIDTTYSSNPASAYGSPRDDESLNRFSLGLSPVNLKGLSVLDAPLPASFDSNGISHAARYGPWPSSVPSKFGLESQSPSVNAAKDARTSETLKLLHTSAFGSSDHLSSSALHSSSSSDLAAAMRGEAGMSSLGGFGGAGFNVESSPPVHSGSDDFFGGAKRATVMHSASGRFAKPRMLSASAPKIDRDWDAEFVFLEEDYVPSALANDVLTPQEKARRGSVRLTDDNSTGSGVQGGGVEVPTSSLPKFGSFGTAASPSSRWGPLFQRQREEESDSSLGPGRSMKHHAPSAFGHVGSPLRNSSLAMEADELNGLPRRFSGGVVGESGLSALTQQIQRTKLGGNEQNDGIGSASPHLHPNAARTTGGAAIPLGGREQLRERGLERHISNGSIGSSARFTTPIDEEDPAFVFSMEDEDDTTSTPSTAHNNQLRSSRKRISGSGLGVGGWSYAGVVAAATAASNSATAKGVNGSGAAGSATKRRDAGAGAAVEIVGGR